MKFNELRAKSVDELRGVVSDMKREQFNLRFQKVAGEQGAEKRPREVRRIIARALTLINQKKGK